MIELTIVARYNKTLDASETSLFNTDQMYGIKANGSGTEFYYPDNTGKSVKHKASQTYTEVKALVAAISADRMVKEVWGYLDATDGKAVGTHNLVDYTTGEEIELPEGAYIVDGFYDVLTTFTSAGADAGTIALGVATDTMVTKTAVAISNGANPWDAGIKALIQDGAVANIVGPTTSNRKLTLTVAGQALTAGKIMVRYLYTVNVSDVS